MQVHSPHRRYGAVARGVAMAAALIAAGGQPSAATAAPAVPVVPVVPAVPPAPAPPAVAPTAGMPGAGPAPGPTRDAARNRIDRLIGTARCRRDSDCATLPLPDQACGGPRGWIAFAPAQTDRGALERALSGLPSDPPGAVSTCLWLPDPGARCRASPVPGQVGRCELRRAGAQTAPTR